MSYRRQRIERLEAMLEVFSWQLCSIVSYAYTLDDIALGIPLDDVIATAMAEQVVCARYRVALPIKMDRDNWIAMAQNDQQT